MSAWVMPASRRLVVFLGGAALLSAGVWIALALRARVPGLDLAGPGFSLVLSPDISALTPWLLVVVAALIAGTLLLWLAISVPRGRREPWLLLTAPIRDGRGSTTISLSSRSLHALVAYLGERVEGVRQVLPTVERTEEGWVIRCEVQLWAGASAPAVAQTFREHLSEQIEHHTGVPVAALRLDCTYDLGGSHGPQ